MPAGEVGGWETPDCRLERKSGRAERLDPGTPSREAMAEAHLRTIAGADRAG